MLTILAGGFADDLPGNLIPLYPQATCTLKPPKMITTRRRVCAHVPLRRRRRGARHSSDPDTPSLAAAAAAAHYPEPPAGRHWQSGPVVRPPAGSEEPRRPRVRPAQSRLRRQRRRQGGQRDSIFVVPPWGRRPRAGFFPTPIRTALASMRQAMVSLPHSTIQPDLGISWLKDGWNVSVSTHYAVNMKNTKPTTSPAMSSWSITHSPRTSANGP